MKLAYHDLACPTLVLVPSPTPRAQADSVLDLFFPWEKVVEEYVRVFRELDDIARRRNYSSK